MAENESTMGRLDSSPDVEPESNPSQKESHVFPTAYVDLINSSFAVYKKYFPTTVDSIISFADIQPDEGGTAAVDQIRVVIEGTPEEWTDFNQFAAEVNSLMHNHAIERVQQRELIESAERQSFSQPPKRSRFSLPRS